MAELAAREIERDPELAVSCLSCVNVEALDSDRSSSLVGTREDLAEAARWTKWPTRVVIPDTAWKTDRLGRPCGRTGTSHSFFASLVRGIVPLSNGPAHTLRRYHLPCGKMPNVHSSRQAYNSMTSLGLIRQYLPQGPSMAHLTQHDCNRVATHSTPGPANGAAIAPRRNAMNRNLQCCTSKLISRRKTYTVQESNRSSHSAVDDVSLSNASV